ncbi:MAG: TetR family transcriptional regulator [Deltaproteobacteria bacterium]|nr:TetR family transcriptional regulator [Deltaproteobacteria bacterium]
MQRARRPEDKEGRRRVILEAAGTLWARSTFDTLTMSGVASQAGLAKGTLYLYFPTKEALLLALLEARLEAWLDELERRFSAQPSPLGSAAAADILCETIVADEAAVGLLVILGTILEHNLPGGRIREFKLWLLGRLERAGAALERKLPFLGPGGGMLLLVRLHALIAGLGQIARPASAVAAVLASPELAAFRLDFDTELRALLRALLRGIEAPAPEPLEADHDRDRSAPRRRPHHRSVQRNRR